MAGDRRAREALKYLPAGVLASSIALAAAGCSPAGPVVAPRGAAFHLAPAAGPAIAPAAPAADAVLPTLEAPDVAPRRADAERPAAPAPAAVAPAPVAASAAGHGGSGGRGRASVRERGGVLTVDLHGFLDALRPAGRWRLLNTVADIATISLTVIQGGATSASATLTQADIVNDAVSRTFTGLATGNAVVLVVAYDALGVPIGSASQVVVISAAGTSVADLAVQLVPSSPAPGPGNTLATSLTFSPPSGTVAAVFPMAFRNLLAAGDGYLYGEHHLISPGQSAAWLNRYSPTDGAELQMYYIDGTASGGLLHGAHRLAYNAATHSVMCGAFWAQDLVTQPGDTSVTVVNGARLCDLVVDAAGVTYYPRNGTTLEVFEAGATRPTTIPAYSAVEIATDGAFWTNRSATTPPTWPPDAAVYRNAPDGTSIGTFALPFPPEVIRSDGAGGVWAMDQGTRIVHVAADGTVGTPLAAQILDFCVDGGGAVWLAQGSALAKVRPDATIAATFPIPAQEVTAGFGYVFAGTSEPPAGMDAGQYVYKIVP